MILMTQGVIFDGLEASRPFLGCLKMKGFFHVQSMIVMFKKSCFDGLEVSRPFRGCLEMKGFEVLDR